MIHPQVAAFQRLAGPMSGRNVIGETTEALHRFILDGWNLAGNPPRIEEDLEFEPKDREEVVYIYMYRLAQNPNLQNSRRLRRAPVFVKEDPNASNPEIYFHRPPLLIDVFYLLSVHSKFRSDAERLFGWLLLRLNEATHLIYRPRRFLLPDGREVDSLGRPYDPLNFRANLNVTPRDGSFTGEGVEPPEREEDVDDDGLLIEKVAVSLVDDLTVGDAINLFTLHEAPYRPFLTYRARLVIDGALYKSKGGTTVRMGKPDAGLDSVPHPPTHSSPNGRMRPPPISSANRNIPGPEAWRVRKRAELNQARPDQPTSDSPPSGEADPTSGPPGEPPPPTETKE